MCPSFPMKPSSACGAFCCAACACRALLSSTGSESSCRGRGTSLKRSATSCLLNSKQECQGLVPTASHGRADKLQWWHRSCHGWVFVVGYAGLSKGVCMSCNTELWGDAWASKDAGSSVAWLVWHGADVSLFLPRVVVVVRACLKILARQLALWTYLLRELGKVFFCSPTGCPQRSGHSVSSSSHCSDSDDPFCTSELSPHTTIRARAVFEKKETTNHRKPNPTTTKTPKLSHWQGYHLPALPLWLPLILTAKGSIFPPAPP